MQHHTPFGIKENKAVAVMVNCANLVKDEYFTRISLDEFFVHQIQYTTRRSNNHVHCKPCISLTGYK